MASTSSARCAIGIVRVSQPGKRKGESFVSPKDQRAAIEAFCVEHGWQLVDVHDELQVSGNALLVDRPGLSEAVRTVRAGDAEIIVGAYTERLWWSHEVRAQVLRLVAKAGGEVWSVDSGCLSNGTAAEDFSGEVRTSADRFSRRQNAEKSRRAVEERVAAGIVPWPNIGPGYVRGPDKRLVVDPATAPAVGDAFAVRADGATIAEVRAMLSERGVKLSPHGTQHLLRSPLVLGRIVFGDLVNEHAHTAIVDRDVWAAVQRVKVPRGRRAKSERLLARLGVLRCANCRSRMVVGTQRANGRNYPFYRCGSVREDCAHRVTISAEMAERLVVDVVRDVLADDEGRASAADAARAAVVDLDAAQAALDAAVSAFGAAGLDGEASTVERLSQLRAVRDDAQLRVDRQGGTAADITVTVEDFDALLLTERRALIRAVVESVEVAPGRGLDRCTVHLNGR
jgi:DNA invertase Pin-like site-specific DNA recombinase